MTMPAQIKLHRSRSPDDNCPHILVIDDDSRIRDLLAENAIDEMLRWKENPRLS